jgi:DNA-binding transcriptional MerR regulator
MHMEKSLPAIPAKRYFTIGEVSDLCGVKPYVLRYWEQEFTQLKPMKRRGNRRYYQHHEVLLIRRIRELLYDQGFTISGARNRLADMPADRDGLAGGLRGGPVPAAFEDGFDVDDADGDPPPPAVSAVAADALQPDGRDPGSNPADPADPAAPPAASTAAEASVPSTAAAPSGWGRRATDLAPDAIERASHGVTAIRGVPTAAEVRAELLTIRQLLQV